MKDIADDLEVKANEARREADRLVAFGEPAAGGEQKRREAQLRDLAAAARRS